MREYLIVQEEALKESKVVENDGLIKVKISGSLITAYDMAVFQGKTNEIFPYKPCAPAVGVVSHSYPKHGFRLGDKVIINPYTKDETGNCKTTGHLAEFSYEKPESLTLYPEGISDDDAIFSVYLSLAVKAVSEIGIKKGDCVIVLGGSVISNIVAQLIKYFQGIPIYISDDDTYVELAKKVGIKNIINEIEEEVQATVADITGGRLADKSIVFVGDYKNAGRLLSLLKDGGSAYILDIAKRETAMQGDLNLIASKGLTVKGFPLDGGEIVSAVNLLVQKVVDFSHFIDAEYSFDNAYSLFLELSKFPNKFICPIIKN